MVFENFKLKNWRENEINDLCFFIYSEENMNFTFAIENIYLQGAMLDGEVKLKPNEPNLIRKHSKI